MTGWTLKKDKELLGGNSEAIKLYSMHRTLVIWIIKAINYSSFFLVVIRLIVFLYFLVNFIRHPLGFCEKKLTGSRQYAWEQTKLMLSSHQRLNVEGPNINNEIHDHSKSINKSKYSEDKDNFHQWLVGFTDGEGSFSIIRVASAVAEHGKWTLFFKISQSSYNLRALYFIKKQLGVGSVHVEANSKADFIIRDRKVIGSVILPIFDKYPLLTSKHYDYLKFKKAYKILTDPNLSTKEKDSLLLELKSKKVPTDYISPAREKLNYKVNDTHDAKLVMSNSPKISQISHLNINSRLEDIKLVISIYWLVGFVEAVGNFVISNESKPIVGFMIKWGALPADYLILHFIKCLLHIPNKIRYVEKEQCNILSTTNNRAVENVIRKFNKIQSHKSEGGKFKGVKSLMFKLWTRAHHHKDNLKKFAKLSEIMIKIRIQNEKGLISKGVGHNNVVQPLHSGHKYKVNVCSKGETKLHIQRPLSSSLNKNLASSRVDCLQRRSVSSLSTTSPCAAVILC